MAGKTGKALVDEISQTVVRYGQCAFWWMGQHGFVLKFGKTVLYVDVFLTPLDARNVAPLVLPSEVTNADGILGTHDHLDHIDRPSWPALIKASPEAAILVPEFVRESVAAELNLLPDRLTGMDQAVTTQIGEVKVTAIPAAHELLSTCRKTGAHEFMGYVFEGNGVCVYHAGDTCIYEGIQSWLRKWKIDLAFLPINGRDAKRLRANCIGNMTFQEAVDLAGSTHPGLTIPTHFEMFDGNTEDPERFMDYMDAKYPHLKAQIPVHGECVFVSTGTA